MPRARLSLMVALMAALLLASPARAGVQILLKNGKLLQGKDLQKKPTWYVLYLEDGSVLTVAADQVSEVRLYSDEAPDGRKAEVTARPGAQAEAGEAPDDEASPDPEPEAGKEPYDPARPSALQKSEPTTLAGAAPATAPAAGGAAAAGSSEPRDLAHQAPGEHKSWPPDGTWTPQSDWPREDPSWERNTWKPRGAESSTWTPDSNWAQDPSANNFNPSTWSKPAKDPTWTPKDAWARTDTSFAIDPAQFAASSAGAAVTAGNMVEGPASWYGEPFRGLATASGQVFDPDALTAAHATLPFGTLLKVSRPDDPRAVVVEITDRGPADRLVNLSRAAAAELGILKSGVATVRVEVLPAGGKDAAGAAPASAGGQDEPKPPAAAAEGSAGAEEGS